MQALNCFALPNMVQYLHEKAFDQVSPDIHPLRRASQMYFTRPGKENTVATTQAALKTHSAAKTPPAPACRGRCFCGCARTVGNCPRAAGRVCPLAQPSDLSRFCSRYWSSFCPRAAKSMFAGARLPMGFWMVSATLAAYSFALPGALPRRLSSGAR